MTRSTVVTRVWEVLTDETGPEWVTAGFVAHTLDHDRMGSDDVAAALDAFVGSGLAVEAGGSYRSVDDAALDAHSATVMELLQS